jgi:hypothetical protein
MPLEEDHVRNRDYEFVSVILIRVSRITVRIPVPTVGNQSQDCQSLSV